MRMRDAFGAGPTIVFGFAVSLWLSGVGGCHASVSPATMQGDRDAEVDDVIGTDLWRSVPLSHVCVTAGRATPAKNGWLHVDDPGVRAVISALPVHAAEVRFVYLGPSRESVPLASGEMRRQSCARKTRAMSFTSPGISNRSRACSSR